MSSGILDAENDSCLNEFDFYWLNCAVLRRAFGQSYNVICAEMAREWWTATYPVKQNDETEIERICRIFSVGRRVA
jgi:hypothetical protein